MHFSFSNYAALFHFGWFRLCSSTLVDFKSPCLTIPSDFHSSAFYLSNLKFWQNTYIPLSQIKFDFRHKIWYHLWKIGIQKNNAGKRRTCHPKHPPDCSNHLVRRRTLFYLHRNANPAAKLVIGRLVSSSQPFSDLDTIDDSCPSDNGRDGVLYRCME